MVGSDAVKCSDNGFKHVENHTVQYPLLVLVTDVEKLCRADVI